MLHLYSQKYPTLPTYRTLSVLLVLVAAVVFIACPGKAASSVSASLNPARFSVDDRAVLNITVNGSGSATINFPKVSGLSFQRTGQSSRVQISNGSYSSSVSYTYIVRADRPGKYTIPPIAVSTGSNTLHTSAIGFQVTRTGHALPNRGTGTSQTTHLGSNSSNKIAFLKLQVQKQKGWVGEVIPLQIKAYFRQNINASRVLVPILKGDGLVMRQLSQKPLQTQETVNGVGYSVLTWNTSISSVKEGRHSLSMTLDATLLLPQRTRRSPFPGFNDQDFFGNDFFQDFFGRYRRKRVTLTSNSFTLDARPLPNANQPANFSGAIGHFSLSVTAKPEKVAIGDPITLDMTISGQGNFDRVDAPKFPDTPGWKTYPPSSETKQDKDPTQGLKTFAQAIMVKDDSIKEIPPVSFTYFDTAKDKYVTLKSTPLPISLKKLPAPTPPPTRVAPSHQTESPKNKAEYQGIAGLAPIHLEMGNLQYQIRPLFAKIWFIMILVLCLAIILAVFLLKMRYRHLVKHPDLQRKKEMNDLLAGMPAQLKEATDQNDSRLYLAVCRKTIQEVLGTLWQTEASAITLADLQAGLDPASQLIAVFAAAEQDVYAGFTLSQAQMREYTIQLRKEFSELL